MSLDSRPLDADQIVDRRRLRRKLTFWRVLTVLVVLAAIGAVFAVSRQGTLTGAVSGQIARVTISGLIRGNRDRVEALERLSNSSVKAVIVHIDSPGGTTAGSEQLYDSLMRLKAKKPMVVVVDGLCASGGYIAALASDHIIAQSVSLVGSIGVLIQYPNFTDLLKTVGVKVEDVKSSPLKAAPNGFEPTSPEAREALQRVVNDNYTWFKDMVRDRRHLAEGEVATVSDGRVHSGRQAVSLKLVDQIGGEPEAIAWMEREKSVAKDLKVRDWRRRSESSSYGLWSFAEAMARGAGLDALAATIARAADQPVGLRLDAPLALWQPAAEK